MMKLLKFTTVILTLVLSPALFVSQAVVANPLYSWTTSDGTPTFSPDPPPKGVSYVIVGPDLQPLPDQPAADAPTAQAATTPAPSANSSAVIPTAPATKNGDIVMTPAPGSLNPASSQATKADTPTTAKPIPAWNPVKYADDPNPTSKKPVFNTRAETADKVTPTATNQITAACLDLREQFNLLESKFANAFSAKEMDTAIVNLSNFKKQNKGNCGL